MTEKQVNGVDARPKGSRWKLVLWLVPAAALAALVLIYVLTPPARPIPWGEMAKKWGGEVARGRQCWSNLRQIGLACHTYADDADGYFPAAVDGPSALALLRNYFDNPKGFQCPACRTASYQDFARGTPTDKSTDYAYVPGRSGDMPPGFILAYDKSLRNHQGHGRNVVYLNARGAWWPAACEKEFQRTLAAQREAIAEWRKSGRPVKELGEIYERILKGKE